MFGKFRSVSAWQLFIVLLVAMLGWSGCGKESTAPGEGEQPTGAFEADGIWIGGLVFQSGDTTDSYLPAAAMIAPDGRTYLLTVDATYLFHYTLSAYGTMERSNDHYQASLKIFAGGSPTGGTLNITNGKIVENTVDNRVIHSLVAQFSGSSAPFAGSGPLSLTRIDSVYDQPSSLSQLTGHWSFFDPEDQTQTFLDVTAGGSFTGGNTAGCQFSGKFAIIDPGKNLYDVADFTIGSCGQPWDGRYRGLASLEEGELNLVIIKEDESFGFLMIFSR